MSDSGSQRRNAAARQLVAARCGRVGCTRWQPGLGCERAEPNGCLPMRQNERVRLRLGCEPMSACRFFRVPTRYFLHDRLHRRYEWRWSFLESGRIDFFP